MLEPGDALGVGEAWGQRQLGAEHGRQAGGAGGLGEAHDAVEAVVVGEGERLEAEPGGFVDELLGMRGTVEERVVGVAVQLGVRHRAGDAGVAGLERLAFATPRGAVAAGVPRQRTGARPSRPLRPESAASSSLQVHDGLLKPISRVSNTCSLGASRALTRHERAWGEG